MALVHYLFRHYGLLVTPGWHYDCPCCGENNAFRINRDAQLAQCRSCGAFMHVTRHGQIFDSITTNPAA